MLFTGPDTSSSPVQLDFLFPDITSLTALHDQANCHGYCVRSPVIMPLRDRLSEAILQMRRTLTQGVDPKLRRRDHLRGSVSTIKEQQGMAELIATLTMGGIVVAMATAMAYLVMYSLTT